MPLTLSIIIPVYNSESYLSRCLESITNQYSNDIEIILIDDGSRDSSGIICDNFSKKYYNITVIHTINQGVSAARNEGINLAKGDWIWFVDSDDTITSDSFFYIRKIISNINKQKIPFILFGHNVISNNNILYTKKYPKKEMQNSCYIKELLSYKITTAPWGYINNKEIIKNIKYNTKLKIGEDLLYNMQCALELEERQAIAISDKIIYNYYINPTSVLQSASTKFKNEYLLLNSVIQEELNYYKVFNRYQNEFHFFQIKNIMQIVIKGKINHKDQEELKDILISSKRQYSGKLLPQFYIKYIYILNKSHKIASIYLKYIITKDKIKVITNKIVRNVLYNKK